MPGETMTLRPFPLLRQTKLSAFLTAEQLEELEQACRATLRTPGTTIYRQNQAAEALHLLIEGSIELRARPPGRHVYRTIEVVGPGCMFGEESVVEGRPYLSTARVLETARVVSLAEDRFNALMRDRTDIALGLVRCAASCLIDTMRRAAILTHAPAEVALGLLLEELAGSFRRNGRPGAIRVTHAQLAGMLHLSRETVSRMLGQMAAEGTVELGRGVIRLRRG